MVAALFSFTIGSSQYHELYDFPSNGLSGNGPASTLMIASNGTMYGTVSLYGGGYMFSYVPGSSSITTLVNFGVGDFPGDFVAGDDGNFYGTVRIQDGQTASLFSYIPGTNTYSVLYNPGNRYLTHVIKGHNSTLYGVGTINTGAGFIYSFDLGTSAYSEIYTFSNSNGNYQSPGTIMQASDGKLYGMGQVWNNTNDFYLYSFDPATSTFVNFYDLSLKGVQGRLIQARDGKIYGIRRTSSNTTDGEIFSIDPTTAPPAFTTLTSVPNASIGKGLMQAIDGNLYGLTDNNYGSMYSYNPVTGTLVTGFSFPANQTYTGASAGAPASSALMQASNGKIYGCTQGSYRPHYDTVLYAYEPNLYNTAHSSSFAASNCNTVVNLPQSNAYSASCKELFETSVQQSLLASAITTGTVTTSSGAGCAISVPFTVGPGVLYSDNVFIAQLSDASGSFANPTAIGKLASTTSGTINATIPSDIPTSTGYRIRVVCANPAIIGSDNGADINVIPVPAAPGTISGNATGVCSSSQTNYAIVSVPGATSYTWTAPANATILSGQGSTFVIVSFGSSFTNGSISVVANNSCGGSGAPSSLFIQSVLLSGAGAIQGPASGLCPGGAVTTASYSVAGITGATSYNWTLPAGVVLNSGGGTTSINVSFNSQFTGGTLSVVPVDGCGSGPVSSIYLYAGNTIAPGAISGQTTELCPSGTSSATYSIAAMPSVTSYNWSAPNGVTLSDGVTSGVQTINNTTATSVTATFGTGFTSGNLSVTGSNACGTGPASNLLLQSTIMSNVSPGTISGQSTLCPTGTATYYNIGTVSGATGYIWSTNSALATITGGNLSGSGSTYTTTNTGVYVTFGNGLTTATITVLATDVCGASLPSTLTLSNTPPSAGYIYGTATQLCPLVNPTMTYYIGGVSSAASYTWTAPAGATITSPSGATMVNGLSTVTNTSSTWVTLSFSNAFTSGNLSVTANNACGSSAPATLALSSVPATPSNIFGLTGVCASGTYNSTYQITPVSGATYNWSTNSSAVTMKAGTTYTTTTVTSLVNTTATNVTLHFGAGFTGCTLTVFATNQCGQSAAPITYTINPLPVPASPSAIYGATCVARSTSQPYSINPVTNATQYVWTAPAGATVTDGSQPAAATCTTGASQVTVAFGSTYNPGNLKVQSKNLCGTSSPGTTLYLNTNVLAAPGAITASQSYGLCGTGTSSATYSIAPVVNADNYTWSAPGGVTLTDGVNTGNTLYNTTAVSVTANFSSNVSGGYVSVTANNGCGPSSPKYTTLTLESKPGPLGAWTLGGNTVSGTLYGRCSANQHPTGVSSDNFTIGAAQGATSYTWKTTSTLATLSDGINTGTLYTSGLITGYTLTTGNSVTVTYLDGFTASALSVVANACGGLSSAAASITLVALPAVPGVISSTSPFIGLCDATANPGGVSQAVYTIPAVSGATYYTWSTNSALATFNGGANTLVNGVVTGNSINTSGNTPTPVTVTFAPGFTSCTLSVTSGNACGNSNARVQLLQSVPTPPANIMGSAFTGLGAFAIPTATYYISSAVPGATSYTWIAPTGATITDAGNTTTMVNGVSLSTITVSTYGSANPIHVTFTSNFLTSGNLSVTANNSCGSSVANGRLLTVAGKPAVPGLIGGPGVITPANTQAVGLCNSTFPTGGQNYATYSISPVPNAVTYTWTSNSPNAVINGGTQILSGGVVTGYTFTTGNPSVQLQFASGFTSGALFVIATNPSGSSAARILTLNSVPATPVANITGANIGGACSNGTATTGYYITTATPGATGYVWTAPAGATITNTGAVTANGISTFSTTQFGSANPVMFTFPSNFTTGRITVNGYNDCGQSSTAAGITITTTMSGQPGNISGPTVGVCSATTDYSFRLAVSGAVSYTWTTSSANASIDGGTIINGKSVFTSLGNAVPTIHITFASLFTACNLSVVANNACGFSGPARTLTISNAPQAPVFVAALAGQNPALFGMLCNGGVYQTTGSTFTGTYNISPVTGATQGYKWSAPAGATVNDGSQTPAQIITTTATTVTVTYNMNVFNSGSLLVQAIGDCGTGNGTSLSVSAMINAPGTPSVPQGSATVGLCSSNTYSLSGAVNNAYAYQWSTTSTTVTITNGTNYTAGTISGSTLTTVGNTPTPITLNFNPGFQTCSLKVAALNACGKPGTQSFLVIKSSLPAFSGGVTSDLCQAGIASASYYINQVTGADHYVWKVPPGATITSPAGATPVTGGGYTVNTPGTDFIPGITAGFPTNATINGNITVSAVGTCGATQSTSLAIHSKPVTAPKIIYNARTTSPFTGICLNSTGWFSINSAPGTAGYYYWGYTGTGVSWGGYGDPLGDNPSQGGTANALDFAGNFSTGTIWAYEENSCGIGPKSTYTLIAGSCKDGEADSTTGINETQAAQNGMIHVYPNPFNDQFRVEFGAQDDEKVVVSLFDISGKSIYHTEQNAVAGLNQLDINPRDVAAGIYILSVSLNGNSKQMRLVKY